MKKVLAIMLSLIMAVVFFGCSAKEEPTTTTATTTTETTTQAPPPSNPLTGESDYNDKALNKRPVAIVVENTKSARPQWGINSPDIIVEGEVEGGISRMLWLYADYTSVPEKIGPLRSARPSFVKFSEFFDCIFVHWGGSHSKGDYIGGYGVIKRHKVNNIDGMDGGKLFARDKTRSVSSEHRGILNGENLESAIQKKKYRTELNTENFTALEFNDKISDIGEEKASDIGIKFSSRTDTRKFKYNTDDKLYHTNDWDQDVKFENIIILSAKTRYITTPYKGSTTTYLNYNLNGGTGYLISNGTKTAIKWKTDKTISITDSNGKPVKLNAGKSYIALESSNNGGKITIK